MHIVRYDLILICLFAANLAVAEDVCVPKEEVVDSALATASLWANVSKSKGSLRYESERLLRGVLENKPESSAENCSKPQMKFDTVPNKFLSKYSDAIKCESLLQQTEEKPFAYSKSDFRSVEELSEWFSDFSQGSGKEGKDLYAKCDGSCSPQYHTTLHRSSDSSYGIVVEVVCGHARDKNDNKYKLKTYYLWECPMPKCSS